MFKECLKYQIVPFIKEDPNKLPYFHGINEWNDNKGYLIDNFLTSQDKYKKVLDYYKIEY